MSLSVTQQQVGAHAVKEKASEQGTPNVARRAAHEDVRKVADVLVHIHSKVLERGADNRDTHPLEQQEIRSYNESL